MTTKILNGFVHARPDAYGLTAPDWTIEGFDLSVWKHEDMKPSGMFVIAPAKITFELPDNWDPRKAMVEVLRKEQEKVRTEYITRVQQLEDEIGKYLAIGG